MAFRKEEMQSIFLEPPPESLELSTSEHFTLKNLPNRSDLSLSPNETEKCSGDFLINFSSSLSITPQKTSSVSTATSIGKCNSSSPPPPPPTSASFTATNSPLKHRSTILKEVQSLLQIESDEIFLAEASPLPSTPVAKESKKILPDLHHHHHHQTTNSTNQPSPLRTGESAATPTRLRLPSKKFSSISDVTNFSAKITKRFEEMDYSLQPSKIPRFSTSPSSSSSSSSLTTTIKTQKNATSSSLGNASLFPVPFVKKKDKGPLGANLFGNNNGSNSSHSSKESSQMCINLSIPTEMLSASYRPTALLGKFNASSSSCSSKNHPPSSPYSPYKKW